MAFIDNDKDYLLHNCEDNERFDSMPQETRQQRIERYEDKYDINFAKVELLHEALAEMNDEQVKRLAINSDLRFIRTIFANHIHKVTTAELGMDRFGDDWYEQRT